MELGAVIGGLLRVVPTAARYARYRGRVELSLTWDTVLYVIGASNEWRRGIKISVTAPRHEEFVAAAGRFERRVGWMRWHAVCPVDTSGSQPWVIPMNRSDERVADAARIADGLASAEVARIRVVLSDPHNRRMVSEPLDVTASELRRRKWS
jgi:hypothetical protein